MLFAFSPLGYICYHHLQGGYLLADLSFYRSMKIMFLFKLSLPRPERCRVARAAISCFLGPNAMTGRTRLWSPHLRVLATILGGGQMCLLYCRELEH